MRKDFLVGIYAREDRMVSKEMLEKAISNKEAFAIEPLEYTIHQRNRDGETIHEFSWIEYYIAFTGMLNQLHPVLDSMYELLGKEFDYSVCSSTSKKQRMLHYSKD